MFINAVYLSCHHSMSLFCCFSISEVLFTCGLPRLKYDTSAYLTLCFGFFACFSSKSSGRICLETRCKSFLYSEVCLAGLGDAPAASCVSVCLEVLPPSVVARGHHRLALKGAELSVVRQLHHSKRIVIQKWRQKRKCLGFTLLIRILQNMRHPFFLRDVGSIASEAFHVNP